MAQRSDDFYFHKNQTLFHFAQAKNVFRWLFYLNLITYSPRQLSTVDRGLLTINYSPSPLSFGLFPDPCNTF